MEAYELLQNISPDLAHASITFRADEGAIPGIIQESLSTDILLAPTRAVDTRYLDAIRNARGLVEAITSSITSRARRRSTSFPALAVSRRRASCTGPSRSSRTI